ncbi:MAG: EAL domain-containing protein [Burkholderiales bacterium]|nr:EAL domain-containing protein [Burkholderiales bacterium]
MRLSPRQSDYLVAITRTLSRYPRLVGMVCGYSLAITLALAACGLAFQSQLGDVESGQAIVLRNMQALQFDAGQMLTQLNNGYSPDCSTSNLNALRSLLFDYHFIRSIQLLDSQHRVYCTTELGLLDAPRAPRVGGIDGSIGHYFLGASIQLAKGEVRTTVVERGPFQVAIGSDRVTESFQQYTDAVWAGNARQRTKIFKSKWAGYTDMLTSPTTPHVRLDWKNALILVTTTMPGVSPITIQTILWPQAFFQKHLLLSLGGGAVCLLLAFLVTDFITRRCRYFQSMEHRIRFLCVTDKLVCHYQPIIELATGRTVGCEVLARLNDGDTLLFPDQFIPAVQSKKLDWVLDAAVSARGLRELGDALPPQAQGFKVALNFFPQNLRHATLSPHLKQVLQAMNRNDLQVELEVTEYNFAPAIMPELQRLQADGFLISIDDFGTGYSNLGMVKKVAPDYLKIDKSFVFEMEDLTLRSSLIPEIIAIAKAVNSKVVAEGIETQGQADKLQAMGVRYGQGYHFAKPMPLAAFIRHLQIQEGLGDDSDPLGAHNKPDEAGQGRSFIDSLGRMLR